MKTHRTIAGWLILLLLLALPAMVQAQLTYITNNGTIIITGYTGDGGALVIPDKINNLPVTSIANYAFYQCYSLTSVTIGTNVTSIGSAAFWDCYTLTSVMIPNGVTNIMDHTFYACGSLTNVIIPNSVTSIGTEAFLGCEWLPNVIIPNSVTNIGFEAFYGCGLTNMLIPNSVTSIGDQAFLNCSLLTAITVDINNPIYSSVNGVLFNKSQTTLIQCPGGLAENYTIPNSVTSIGNSAFFDCESLTNVTIGANVTSIGTNAFAFCFSLTSVYFKGNAPAVDSSAFDSDNNATVYYLPGTTGWGPPGMLFGGRPTARWLLPYPMILDNGPYFGMQNNRFGFIISWATNRSVVVQACTNLTNPVWSPVRTNPLAGGSGYFSDPQWTNYPGRFYRLRSP
jgi:hypothetical protein